MNDRDGAGAAGTALAIACLLVALLAGCGSTNTPAPASQAVQQSPNALAGSPSPAASSSQAAQSSAAPTATPVLTPTPAATPAPTPIVWKTYTSKRAHFTIQYPPTWVVTPATTKLVDQFDNYGYPYVYIDRDTVSGTVSVSLTVTAEIGYFKSHYKARLLSNAGIKLAGWPGRLLTFQGVDRDLKVIIQEVVVAKGSVVYYLWIYADFTTAPADRQTFRKMYLSWRAK